jgi:hypothetical protein
MIECTPVLLPPEVSYVEDLFLSIMHKLSETSLYFCDMYDATGRTGLIALQKCTAALRQLPYGMAAYIIDEYLKLRKTTALECLEY